MAGDSRLSARFGATTEDFKNGINEINRELKVVESSFRASASTMGDWSSSSTGLELKISSLNEKIALQSEKVSALCVEHERIVEAQGANSVSAQNAEIKLNKETETLGKLKTELKDTTGNLKQLGDATDEAGDKAQESGSKFKGFSQIIDSAKKIIKDASVIIAGVAVAIKKALDFGEEGAQIVQVEESYNSLMEQIGASADVLDRLSAASRGTIDEGDLMAATMKMLTGTSAELSKALVENAPALMEMAKASNKLNPTMGSTLDLYEALSTSIKNLTPRGLKQVGLIIDSTAAYEDYARSLGKAVDALTEEEKSMALLNATLEKAPTLLKQVGGDTAAASDSFDRANVAINNLKETVQVKLLPVLGDAAIGLSLILGSVDTQEITTVWGDFFNELITKGASATEIIDAYNQKQLETNQAFNEWRGPLSQAVVNFIKLTQDESKFLSDQPGLQQALLKTSKSFDEYWRAITKANGGNGDLVESNNWLVQAMQAAAQAQWDAAQGTESATEQANDYNDVLRDYANILETSPSAIEEVADAALRQADIQEKQAAATEKSAKATEWYNSSILNAKLSTEGLFNAMDTGLDNTIANWIEKLAWFAAGGLKLQQQFEQVKLQLLAGTITPEQADLYFDQLYVATQQLKVDMGEIKPTEAVKNISETLKIPIQEAWDLWKKFKEDVANGVSGKATITTDYPGGAYEQGAGLPAGGTPRSKPKLPPVDYPGGEYEPGAGLPAPSFAGASAAVQQNIKAAVAGMNAAASVSVSGSGGAGAAGDTFVTIAPGAITVTALPGMDEETLAQAVSDRMGSVLDVARSKGLR